MRWLLLGALLFGCESTKPLGANDPDASMLSGGDGGVADDDGGAGGDGGQPACSCDASSCGSRICGRSECGFPCGQCGPGLTCLLGVSCTGGADTACLDAFGDRVGILDLGFRACPNDATKQQRCMCNGGGPNDWTSCDPCIEVCAHAITPGITCGTPECAGGDVCCVSIIDTSSLSCSGSCGGLNYTRACDGPEDCATGSSCCGNNDGFTTTCTPGATCGAVDQFCHTTDDCPTAKPHCCPGAVDDMRSCSATDSPTCT